MVFLHQYLLWLHVTTNNPVQHLVQILYIIYINILFSKQHTGQCLPQLQRDRKQKIWSIFKCAYLKLTNDIKSKS